MVTLSKSAGGRGRSGNTLGYPIIEIDGIGEQQARRLIDLGIRSTDQLLEACRTPRGRRTYAAKSEITETLLLKWTNHADLFRIKGIARQFAELLEVAGVNSMKDLKARKADALSQAMREANQAKKLCKVSPSVAVVRKWIDQAKNLPPKVTY
jgi:predicted flap endonuclease-1-like 5' DNA nuclease